MDKGPQLGQLIEDGDRRRDAIHIAVAPVTAADRLTPGQHDGLVQAGNLELVGPCGRNIGIVERHIYWLRYLGMIEYHI